jgi:hypothetical protein
MFLSRKDLRCFIATNFFKFFLQSSEYEEYSDSEEEFGARLKPVFVRK